MFTVYEAFEQWKQLVRVLCFSERSLLSRQSLFLNTISVLHFQLKEIPQDFFVDIVSRNNFLTTTLQVLSVHPFIILSIHSSIYSYCLSIYYLFNQVFFSNIQETNGLDAALVKKAHQFKNHLTKKFKWDFTREPEDEAPTIVESND